MPRRKTWFNVSHDLLNDHELHAMERQLGRDIGPKLLHFWLWFLSRLDQTENHLPFSEEALRSACHAAGLRLASGYKAAQLLLESRWLAASEPLQSGFKAVISSPNYAKYHPSPEHKNSGNGSLPPFPSPSGPKERKEKNPKIYLSLGNGQAETEQPPDDPKERLQWFARNKKDPADYKN